MTMAIKPSFQFIASMMADMQTRMIELTKVACMTLKALSMPTLS